MRTGVANLASVLVGLRRAGGDPIVSADPSVIHDAERVVLPGVGAFGPAMEVLRGTRLDEVLVERVAADRPLFAVCLGLQVLARRSAESPGVEGLGVLDVDVVRFGNEVTVPQLGWNSVAPAPSTPFLTPGWAYFANSYHLSAAPDGWHVATTEHGGRFVSAIARGRVLACQFHPELSGRWGTALIRRWLATDLA